MQLATKRVNKDILLFHKNKEELEKRGIHVHVNEQNLFDISVLIIAKHKQDLNDPELKSPYTGGFFMFKLTVPSDFPLSPPKVVFHPQQNLVRLHPNYYENGKVCLSTLNTWGNPDWTPSMSILSIIDVLEERLNELSLWFEPSRESESNETLKTFNKCVEYGVFETCICRVLEGKYGEYYIFDDIIRQHWSTNKADYIGRLEKLSLLPKRTVAQQFYGHTIRIDYQNILDRLKNV